jgi:hypothetical protein
LSRGQTTGRVEEALDGLFIEHHGVGTRRHALNVGVPAKAIDRRVAAGRLEIVHRGVLRRPGVPMTFSLRVEAARLAVGDEAVAGRRTAGSLHELVPAREIEIMTTASRRNRPTGFTVIRTNYLPDDHVVPVRGIPTTSVPRTILDLGAVLSESDIRRVVRDALRLRKTSSGALHEVFANACRPGRPGSTVARSTLAGLDLETIPTESELEIAMFETVRGGGFPEPAAQVPVFDGDMYVARPDGAYLDLLVDLEADGYEWHSAKPEWQRDRIRSNRLVALGWVVLHFTWEDAARPAEFLDVLGRTREKRRAQIGG